MTQINVENRQDKAAEEAAAWFLRIQDGFSQSEFREWRQWLNEDAAHAEAFDAVGDFWRDLERLEKPPWPSSGELARDDYDGSAPLPVDKRDDDAAPRRRRRTPWWFAAAATVGAVSLIGFLMTQEPAPAADSFRTGTAEHRTISLQDGSSITLGAESTVEIAYTVEERYIELRHGEAYFKVATDPDRPFVVAAGQRTVQALGTEFGINIGVRDIRVSVVEGRVRVEGPPLTLPDTENSAPNVSDLGEGDVLDFNSAGSVGIVSAVDPKLTTSWLNGRLAYVGAPLESVIADVNRYSKTELVIGDESIKRLAFTGTIFSDDIEEWLIGIEKAFPLRLVPIDGHEILLIQEIRQPGRD